MIKIFLHCISCICVALGQPAWLPWLGPLAASMGFALHWHALDGLSGRIAARYSFLWFFTVQLFQLSWMLSFEYLGIAFLFVYLLLAIGLGLQFAWMTKVFNRNLPLSWLSLVSVAGFWTLMEWARLQILCGFAFNFVGISLSCYVWPLQMASLLGLLGMSFWVMFTNLWAWKSLRLRVWKGWLFLALCPYIYGCLHVWYQDAKQKENLEGIPVLLVQTGIPISQKYSLKGREEEFLHPKKQWQRILHSISCYSTKSLSLLIFPEAVLPWGLNSYAYSQVEIHALFEQYFGTRVLGCIPPLSRPFYEQGRVSNAYCMQILANFFQAPVVAGLDYQGDEGLCYNSAFYFEPGAMMSPLRYDKRILLPFAEYMPCSWLSFFSRLYGIQDFFERGKEAKVWGSFRISPSICYEELFSSVMRDSRRKGANFFVNLSNDGYYPSSKLPMQHFSQGLIRSVENGVPLVRACNTGVTAAVDSLGRVLAKLQNAQGDVEKLSGCLWVEVPKAHYTTFFSFFGDLPVLLISVMSIGVSIVRRKFFFRKLAVEIGLDENDERS